jgi:ATP-binding cassette subfamily B (MDR/TAP) protein 1
MMGAIYLGIAALVFGWIMIAMWVITGQRQASKCKKSYYESLLKQDAEFFDCNQQSFINSQFNLDTDYFQNAIGEKIGLVLQIFGNFVTALAFSFWQGWLMTLVMIGTLILVFLSASMNMKNLKNKENKFLELYSRAGGRADEAISSIKTVKQFNAEMHESNLY